MEKHTPSLRKIYSKYDEIFENTSDEAIVDNFPWKFLPKKLMAIKACMHVNVKAP